MISAVWRPVNDLTGSRSEKTRRPYLFALALALVVSGALALTSGLLDLTDGSIDEPWFWLIGVVLIAAGYGGVDRHQIGVPQTADALGASVVFWLSLIAISTAVYVIIGAVGRIDDALFESVAGYSTTAMSIFDDDMLATTDRSVLWWRTGTQWIGGASALIFGVAIIPFWGGGRELADPNRRHASFAALAPTPATAIRHILEIYVSLTIVATGVFVVLRVNWFDAVTHAMSTVSTGGFSNYRLSTAAFDSPAVEWATAAFMLIAGSSIAIVWWVLRGQVSVLWRSLEVRVYLTVVVAASALFSWWGRNDAEGVGVAIRHGVFKATSTLSTTGHQVTDWTSWSNGTYGLMLFLVGVGSMAGSVGGGFRWLRVIEAVQFFRRELTQQLHPAAVVTVKVGSRTVSERSLERMNAQQTLVVVVGTIGFFGVSLFGSDLITSVSASISALSTFGPGLGAIGPFTQASEVLSAPARAVLMPLMLAGRLSIYPLFMTAGTLASARPARTATQRVREFRSQRTDA